VLTQSGLGSSLTGSLGPLFEFPQDAKTDFVAGAKANFTPPTTMEASQVNASLVRVVQQVLSSSVILLAFFLSFFLNILNVCVCFFLNLYSRSPNRAQCL
jgi:hypothetical protein